MRYLRSAGGKRLMILGLLLFFGAAATLEAFLRPNGWIASFLRATHAEWEKPRIFGGFHLTALAVCILLALLVVFGYKKRPLQRLDCIVFGAGILLFLLELYKQLYYHVILGNGQYNFGILPLQFCSYALYLYLLIPLLPEGKCKDTLYLFTALYQTMGGCIVMAYPLFYPQIALCIHTMLWHTVMIAVGILILCGRGYGSRYFGEMLPAGGIFLVTVAIATALNFLLTPYTGQSPQPLNLFYMSPYHPTSYIIIGDVQRAFGWAPSLLCYVLLFLSIGAHTVWGVGWLIRRIEKRK